MTTPQTIETVTVFSNHNTARVFKIDASNRCAVVLFKDVLNMRQIIKSDILVAIDPDGGPYIGVGESLSHVDNRLPSMIVKSIEKGSEKNQYILQLF